MVTEFFCILLCHFLFFLPLSLGLWMYSSNTTSDWQVEHNLTKGHLGGPLLTKEFLYQGFLGGASGNKSACECRRHRRRGLGRSPEGGLGNPLQYSCLEKLMERKAWLATVHRIAQSRTRLQWLGTHAYQWKRRPDFPKDGGGAQSSGLSLPAKQGSCVIWGS